jgi:polysaccharide pyruvyl transferase CsaB
MAVKKAVICGYYGRGNAGDEALLAVLLQMLPSDWQAVVLTANPEKTQKLHGPRIQVVDRYHLGQLYQSLRQGDYFLWGGGSLMQDSTSWRSPVYYGGLMLLAQRMGLKTLAWAQGIGPLHSPFSQWLAQQCLASCTRISVRDSQSAELLASWGIPCLLAPDPVWCLTSQPAKGLWDLPAPRIAVALRSHPLLTPAKLRLLSTALVHLQQATSAHILLIPFQPRQDLAIAQVLQQALPHSSTIWVEENPHLLKGVFRGVEMAITMRLHSLIMALGAGCRCFALSYDPKVRSVMQDLQVAGWDVSSMPEDPSQITQAWLEVYANGEPLSELQIQSLSDQAGLHAQLFAS